jgi:hypothetical protein
MQTEIRKLNSRQRLTTLESMRSIAPVARFRDIMEGLRRQVETNALEIHAINDQMNELRTAYQKYRELTDQVKDKEERVRIAAALIASNYSRDDDPEELSKRDDRLVRLCAEAGIRVEQMLEAEIRKVPLWKLIREIVRQTPEIQVVDLENSLKELRVDTSRQAIESALGTHRKEFRIVKRGREKFVSLKGA